MHYYLDKQQRFAVQLLNWYELNHRTLPWRNTRDPYKIWLSEIILQQTRVAQGKSYYLKFIDHYPTINDLANAQEEEVLKDWQGLGYYSRARNLHETAKFISKELNNIFPSIHNDIKKLKGVGDYTSAAIASFAFDLPHAVVDGNVYRVLSRLFGIETPIDSTTGKKEFAALAQSLLDKTNPADYNQAIMELGAIQCVPKNPDCFSCPYSNKCIAFLNNTIDQLPIKTKKIKQRKRYLNYLIIFSENKLLINHRTKKGIWQNLYDFPLAETEEEVDQDKLFNSEGYKKILKSIPHKLIAVSKPIKHILSHQILFATFYHIQLQNKNDLNSFNFEVINNEDLAKKPIPKLIENYLNEETNLLSLFD